MWPAGAVDAPFTGLEESGDPHGAGRPSASRRHLAWVAVGLMVVGVALLAAAVVLRSWLPAVAGVVLGLVGTVLAYRAQILEDVSLSG